MKLGQVSVLSDYLRKTLHLLLVASTAAGKTGYIIFSYVFYLLLPAF